jgi:hypothetical protein
MNYLNEGLDHEGSYLAGARAQSSYGSMSLVWFIHVHGFAPHSQSFTQSPRRAPGLRPGLNLLLAVDVVAQIDGLRAVD